MWGVGVQEEVFDGSDGLVEDVVDGVDYVIYEGLGQVSVRDGRWEGAHERGPAQVLCEEGRRGRVHSEMEYTARYSIGG